MRRVAFFLLACLGAAVPMTGAAGAQTGSVLTTTLTGAEAVPPGDPEGSGTGLIVIAPGGTVCFVIFATGIEPISGAHIHEAPAGEVGGHAVDLFGRLIPLPGGRQVFTGCVQGAEHAADVEANPAGYYLNVHTEEFSSGALRGQLGD